MADMARHGSDACPLQVPLPSAEQLEAVPAWAGFDCSGRQLGVLRPGVGLWVLSLEPAAADRLAGARSELEKLHASCENHERMFHDASKNAARVERLWGEERADWRVVAEEYENRVGLLERLVAWLLQVHALLMFIDA